MRPGEAAPAEVRCEATSSRGAERHRCGLLAGHGGAHKCCGVQCPATWENAGAGGAGDAELEPVMVELPVIRCPTCDVPWVLRWSFSLTGGADRYVWQRDCRHKSRPPADEGVNEWAPAGVARLWEPS